MNLTKNEKKVIKFLLKDARTSDAAIARELKISLQAVRNIRKKLENKRIIKGYSTTIDYEKLEINVFAIVLYRITAQGWEEFKEEKINKWLLQPNVAKFYRIPNGDITHIAEYGFRTIHEMNKFFQTLQSKYSKYIEIIKVHPISNGNVIRESEHELINTALKDGYESPKPLDIK